MANLLIGVEGFGAEVELLVRDARGALRRTLSSTHWTCIPLPEGAELVVRHAPSAPEVLTTRPGPGWSSVAGRIRLEDAEHP